MPNATVVDVSADCNDDQRLLVVASSFEWQQPTVCSGYFPSDHAVITSTFWRGVECKRSHPKHLAPSATA